MARARQKQGSETAVPEPGHAGHTRGTAGAGGPRCRETGNRRRAEALQGVAGAPEPLPLVRDSFSSVF